ncbi:hypothetical protein [Spirosoma sp. KNUC1025]|uniref:hypothetical protein n=1 Tax=Spirosoma sp. KNUC1025 TaxID=2894082 RepID=UPI0038696C95|nr:hypothetical protein LN737_19325 [Spirosoma sp. KNUC1025]
MPAKEANLLHQLVTDYERYKQQGFIDAAHDVLRIIQRTCDRVIENPDLFKPKEEIQVTTKAGNAWVVLNGDDQKESPMASDSTENVAVPSDAPEDESTPDTITVPGYRVNKKRVVQ